MTTSPSELDADASADDTPAQPARDRIAQAYLGKVGDQETQAIARARVDWLAANVRGARVLDIGCSEGILPILLAQRGCEVIGIDVNADALDYARELMAEELAEVQSRVQWLVGSALDLDLPRGEFDTVILGEVIEHLDDPAAMLEVAGGCLRRGGLLLVTTPYGYFPDPDHRQTFTLAAFVALLRAHCAPLHLEVVDGYIRFVGTLNEPADDAWEQLASPERLLRMTESATLQLQRSYRARLEHRYEQWRQSQQALRDSKTNAQQASAQRAQLLADVRRWKAAAEDLQNKRALLNAEIGRLTEKSARLEQERNFAQRDFKQLDARVRTIEQELASTRSQYALLNTEKRDLERKYGQASRDVRSLTDQLRNTKAELADVYASKRYRIGELFVAAARSPRQMLRLPFRLWRIFRAPRGPGSNRPQVQQPAPKARDAVEQRNRQFQADFARFLDKVETTDAPHMVVNFGGTTYMQNLRANRPIRLTRSFAAQGVPVLFNFHRWHETDHIPSYDGGIVFQSPIDKTPALLEGLFARHLGNTRGVFIVSYPHPSVCKLINLANVNGWATLYDCRDDWEEFEKVGMAKWYRSSVEKYVVNNCDLTCCVSRPLQAKLAGLTATRPVMLSPNAYDPQFLADAYAHRPSKRIKVGYFGHLTDRWFDWESLIWIARQRPEITFEIIGHGAPENLDLPPNVTLLGPKSHPEICAIAAEWHVGLIPFRVGKLSDGVDPIKIYEYFALELPVVSFRMPQIADYPNTTTVESRAAFVEALDHVLQTPPAPPSFHEFLKHNTWDDRARQMLNWADEILARGAFEKTLCKFRPEGER